MEEIKKIQIRIKVEGNKTNKTINTTFIEDNKETDTYVLTINDKSVKLTKGELRKYPVLYGITSNNYDDEEEEERKTFILYPVDLSNYIGRETEGMNQKETEEKIKEIITKMEDEIKDLRKEAETININKTFEAEI